jgi:dGTPase
VKATRRMEWKKLLCTKRLGTSARTSLLPSRTDFDADVDRVVFSGAFRRLSRKTQVHPLAANDHVHTRLTHSLEVGQVGRALGKALGQALHSELPKGASPSDLASIMQAASLAHDIGNPPFGHAGEEAMAHWFQVNGHRYFGSLSKEHRNDLSSVEGNAQGFRILTQTENHLFQGGLRLTYATLGAFLKYPWSSRVGEKKFGAYLTEEKLLQVVADGLGLVKVSKHKWCRHPLAHLLEAADDICYAVIDLEDAVELRLLSFEEVSEVMLDMFEEKERKEAQSSFADKVAFRVNLARLRGPVFDKLVAAAVQGFAKSYGEIMSGRFEGSIFFDALPKSSLERQFIDRAKKLAADRIFSDTRKVEVELGAYSTFECLLEAYCKAAVDKAQHLGNDADESAVSWKSALVLKLLGDHAPAEGNAPPGSNWSRYQCLRRVNDFVTGMTDNYAVYVAKQLQGMAFSGVQRP